MRTVRWCLLLSIFVVLIFSRCEHGLDKLSSIRIAFEVSYNPYEQVNWAAWKRCLSQHHDHVSIDVTKIRDYDAAGYDAICLLHYSGFKSKNYAQRQRLWPLSSFLSEYQDDGSFLATTKNLKFFIPSMEEIGTHHMTSPFLKTWIARWEPLEFAQRSRWHYDSPQECLDTIRRFGGLPIIAHPTAASHFYLSLENVVGIEIYNAFYRFEFLEGNFSLDKNLHFRTVWDDLLTHRSSRIFGYAVNDWYGPFNKEVARSHPDVFDSGKTLVLLPEFTLAAYRASLEKGAFFAIEDVGLEKGRYPWVEKIEVQHDSIEVKVDTGAVNWIFNGLLIDTGPVLQLTHLPSNMNYVRAEISTGSATVYIQPFSLRPVLAEGQ